MAELKQVQCQSQKQVQKQVQRMSQQQIQGMNFLKLSTKDLKNEIDRLVQENPALEYVDKTAVRSSSKNRITRSKGSADADSYEAALENTEGHGESLQEHLMTQLNIMTLSPDQYELCQKLIYNLDKNGFYGSTLAPETLLDKSRPKQNVELLRQSIALIQKMDPVGVCCKNIEESLYVQAKLSGEASDFTLFILNGHLNLLNPPDPAKIVRNCKNYSREYHAKTFGHAIFLDNIDVNEDMARETFDFISHLNFHPAAGYVFDPSAEEFNRPDIVLTITKESGYYSTDDFSRGIVAAGKDYYYQVKYASGELPELTISTKNFASEKEIEEAKTVINNIKFRENTIVLQGCAIVREQLEFFEKGTAYLKPLTRRKIAEQIGVHESTVSRTSSRKDSKCFQTPWGIFKASYFFSSGVALKASGSSGNEAAGKSADSENGSVTGNKLSAGSEADGSVISSSVVKQKIQQLIQENEESGLKELSDSKLTKLLNDQGIKIARRTVAKYRSQLGVRNSYLR